MVGLAGRLHDVGKVAVPDAILQKPGRLTDEEWERMRTHSRVGADVVSRVPALGVLAPIIRAHHERWDGQGYTDRLAGEAIPLAARIVAVADAFGAMTTDRPYRAARDAATALHELQRCAGMQFDLEIAHAHLVGHSGGGVGVDRGPSAPGPAAGLRARGCSRPPLQHAHPPRGAGGRATVRRGRGPGARCRLRARPPARGGGHPLRRPRGQEQHVSSGDPPAYRGRGRPPTRGTLVRPLPRRYKGRTVPATPPDRTETWQDDGVLLRADIWTDLVLPTAEADGPAFTVVAVHDPRYREPLLLASPLAVTAQVLRALYPDRWPVEQLPLAAKQMVGAARQFVHAPETCQRLPELALLAGAILSYAAATAPAVPTGFWDRHPQPTPGRLRRALAGCPFPHDFPLPARIRAKAAPTAHLPTGFWGQQRCRAAVPEEAAAPPAPPPCRAAA